MSTSPLGCNAGSKCSTDASSPTPSPQPATPDHDHDHPSPGTYRLRRADLARLATVGIRTRKLRATLSALGIAIGVAAIVAVLGLSASSQAGLLAEISRLGTNLLTVADGKTLSGQTAELPTTAPRMIARIGPVTAVDNTGQLNDHGGQWFYLIGILEPTVLAPDIDTSILIGYPSAQSYLDFDGHPTQIYLRASTDHVNEVHEILARTANPENPGQLAVSNPSDALIAQAEAEGALNSLLRGLGAVSLLVGAIGIGNVIFISVFERRSEIGLRRALGAAKGHIRIQFLTEAMLLSTVGGGLGVGLGAATTTIYAHAHNWTTVIPTVAWAGGLASAVVIGALAGLLPAMRAASLSPTQALWSM